ncbi:MAG: tetraacyldisaccharide 4'-kinase [Thermomonas sp.]
MTSKVLPQPPAWWHDGSSPPIHARMLSAVYGTATALRRRLYRSGIKRSRHPGVPVIVVGNIVAGGTGKTPLVIALVNRLRAAGFTPGVASRGHGRSDAKTARWVDADSDAALSGDEALLIANNTGAKVRVDRDRVAAAQALAKAGCDVIVCDDGLQHYRLARDIEIEVVDARRRYGNGRLLPAGPLREPMERAADCTFRVLNLGVVQDEAMAPASGLGEWPMRLQVIEALLLLGGHSQSLAAFAGQRVHAVAGIGDPERFFTTLRALDIAIVPHAFPDHHAYQAQDLDFGSPLPVLMTEKDAVKCTAFAQRHWYSVPVQARMPDAFWAALLEKLAIMTP